MVHGSFCLHEGLPKALENVPNIPLHHFFLKRTQFFYSAKSWNLKKKMHSVEVKRMVHGLSNIQEGLPNKLENVQIFHGIIFLERTQFSIKSWYAKKFIFAKVVASGSWLIKHSRRFAQRPQRWSNIVLGHFFPRSHFFYSGKSWDGKK